MSVTATQSPYTMSPTERSKACILIVDGDANDRNNLRTAVKQLGFGQFTDAPNHLAALERLDDRRFTHVIFEAKSSNMPSKEFLAKIFSSYPQAVCIPTSFNPNVDEVFDMLIMGAKGFLVKPFTADSVDDAICSATKGEPISSAVLNAKDRNEALVAILMGSLDKTATILRQAQQFETAKRDIPRSLLTLKRSAELAKLFCKGGNDGMIESIEKFCIERSKGPATRLGRLRRRLATTRVDDETDEAGA